MNQIVNSETPSTYRLLANWRWLIWMPLVAIVAIVLAAEFGGLRIEIYPSGLRYHGVGYVAEARCPQISYRDAPRKVLLMENPTVHWAPWLAWTIPVVSVFQPYRTDRAEVATRLVPLWYSGTLRMAPLNLCLSNT